MTTLSMVDAQQRDAVGSTPPSDPQQQSLADFRKFLSESFSAMLTPHPVKFEERHIPSPKGAPPVRVLLFRPEVSKGNRPAIVYVHGGGMIAGTPDMMAGAHADLAKRTGTVIVSVDYRLSPETPFPGGLEDVHTTLAWVQSEAAALGVDASSISLMGDSGGGCLAAAVALLARDRGEVAIRAQFLVYPMLDYRTGTAGSLSEDPTTGEFIWTRTQNRNAWAAVRGEKDIPQEKFAYYSPALATDLSGLPPTAIIVGALDLFRDEDVRYAQRLMAASVTTEIHVYPGAVHGFDVIGGDLSDRAKADMQAAILRLA